MTDAGATYPYKNDPANSNLRIAPSFPPLNELEQAMQEMEKHVGKSNAYLEIEERVEEALKMVQLNGYQKRSIQKLSGGQRQRVAIARALVNNPEMIVADEPTGSLDSQSQENVLEIFKELAEAGKTVIIVTHNPEVADYADVVIKMKDGEVVETIEK